MNRLALVLLSCATLLGSTGGSAGAWIWSNEERKAEREMKAGNFEKALRHYEMAKLRDPDNPALYYNVGNVLHMDNKWQEAIGEYSGVLGKLDKDLEEMTLYNMGNTYYRSGDLEKAIESYVGALLERPDDYDAKHNLEMALEKTEEQQQREQDGEQGGEKKEEKGEEKEEEPREQDQDQEQQQDQEKGTQETDQERRPKPQEGELTKEQAERILNALSEQERKERKDLKETERRAGVRVGKDW